MSDNSVGNLSRRLLDYCHGVITVVLWCENTKTPSRRYEPPDHHLE